MFFFCDFEDENIWNVYKKKVFRYPANFLSLNSGNKVGTSDSPKMVIWMG